MSDVPLDAPSPCPGTQSDLAGKASACEGCPNRSLCSSGQARLPLSQREPDTILSIKRRLGSIRHRIIILSGKGGVGKSSLSVCLARGLSRCERSQEIDFCRKLSIPILGVVENMVEFVCPTCKHTCPLFPSFTGGASSLSTTKHNENADDSSFSDLEIIGRLPLDPRLTRALDEGLCPFELAESNSFISQHSKNADGGLQSSDAVIVSFQELFNNLLEKLRK
ncbi:putative nucleotide-binding protein 1 (nbp 1)/nbp35 [Schistosoma mansoni]|uniref:putative nucleotide-binding protein 1 (nbp 1)/nbp35 n=1 Tax=Schistosoma mansoni TaxID=6183 RepID=UPI00022DCB30|nr:putative nucleotide-binding protein 1 (nbp 1)/nbp35 [Schistosoma mansoni]|eukprot:XP_018654603.1 putative nucleotide-binding protein 1 (nbp 1)/nbp35 [Schistosoma mansoni]